MFNFFCVQDVIYPDWSHRGGLTSCLLVFAVLFWIFRAARVLYQIYQFGEIRTFYRTALGGSQFLDYFAPSFLDQEKLIVVFQSD